MAIDKSEFRRVLGRFAAGVTVVTTRGADDKPYGLTATAFSSVSLDPPLVLVCVSKTSSTHPHFRVGGCMAVNFLRREQEPLSLHFATSGGDKFSLGAWSTQATGAPVLTDALGWVDCHIERICDGGDHTIYLAQVQGADASEGSPLLYYAGKHRGLAD